MRSEQEQIITNRIEPVLTGVQVLKLEVLLERVYFSTNEKRAGADYNQLGSNLFCLASRYWSWKPSLSEYTFQPMRREQEQIILFNQ
jgi:hypothetical protein